LRGLHQEPFQGLPEPLWPGLRPITPPLTKAERLGKKKKVRFVVGIVPEQKDEFVGYVTEVTKGKAKIREFLDWERERKIGKKRY